MQDHVQKPPLPRIDCPHCGGELPHDFVMRAHGTISARMRTSHAGPARVIYRCGCGELFSAREIRGHLCPKKPARGEAELASETERQSYLDRRRSQS